ncbi:hypothetical protein AYI70_g3310 [Smittium culicis]|uniref:Uncharacterized protein n=1 Tax=Smittium culicis TaxID=133412 RepID=A0A1R1Y4C1_9FUNG|nr:hypothetical protein AYI70_g3310 [Smittium culicis]
MNRLGSILGSRVLGCAGISFSVSSRQIPCWAASGRALAIRAGGGAAADECGGQAGVAVLRVHGAEQRRWGQVEACEEVVLADVYPAVQQSG